MGRPRRPIGDAGEARGAAGHTCVPLPFSRIRAFAVAGATGFPSSWDWEGSRLRRGDWAVHTPGDKKRTPRLSAYLHALWGEAGPPSLVDADAGARKPLQGDPERRMPSWTFWA